MENQQRGPKQGNYFEQVERDHPGYLHAMFRIAGKKIGFDGTWLELAEEMNKQSKKEEEVSEGRPILTMSRRLIQQWFEKSNRSVRKQW